MASCVPIRVLFLSVWPKCIFLHSSQRGDLSHRRQTGRTRAKSRLRQGLQVRLLIPRIYRLLGHHFRVEPSRRKLPLPHLVYVPLARPYRRNFVLTNPLVKQTDLVLTLPGSGRS